MTYITINNISSIIYSGGFIDVTSNIYYNNNDNIKWVFNKYNSGGVCFRIRAYNEQEHYYVSGIDNDIGKNGVERWSIAIERKETSHNIIFTPELNSYAHSLENVVTRIIIDVDSSIFSRHMFNDIVIKYHFNKTIKQFEIYINGNFIKFHTCTGRQNRNFSEDIKTFNTFRFHGKNYGNTVFDHFTFDTRAMWTANHIKTEYDNYITHGGFYPLYDKYTNTELEKFKIIDILENHESVFIPDHIRNQHIYVDHNIDLSSYNYNMYGNIEYKNKQYTLSSHYFVWNQVNNNSFIYKIENIAPNMIIDTIYITRIIPEDYKSHIQKNELLGLSFNIQGRMNIEYFLPVSYISPPIQSDENNKKLYWWDIEFPQYSNIDSTSSPSIVWVNTNLHFAVYKLPQCISNFSNISFELIISGDYYLNPTLVGFDFRDNPLGYYKDSYRNHIYFGVNKHTYEYQFQKIVLPLLDDDNTYDPYQNQITYSSPEHTSVAYLQNRSKNLEYNFKLANVPEEYLQENTKKCDDIFSLRIRLKGDLNYQANASICSLESNDRIWKFSITTNEYKIPTVNFEMSEGPGYIIDNLQGWPSPYIGVTNNNNTIVMSGNVLIGENDQTIIYDNFLNHTIYRLGSDGDNYYLKLEKDNTKNYTTYSIKKYTSILDMGDTDIGSLPIDDSDTSSDTGLPDAPTNYNYLQIPRIIKQSLLQSEIPYYHHGIYDIVLQVKRKVNELYINGQHITTSSRTFDINSKGWTDVQTRFHSKQKYSYDYFKTQDIYSDIVISYGLPFIQTFNNNNVTVDKIDVMKNRNWSHTYIKHLFNPYPVYNKQIHSAYLNSLEYEPTIYTNSEFPNTQTSNIIYESNGISGPTVYSDMISVKNLTDNGYPIIKFSEPLPSDVGLTTRDSFIIPYFYNSYQTYENRKITFMFSININIDVHVDVVNSIDYTIVSILPKNYRSTPFVGSGFSIKISKPADNDNIRDVQFYINDDYSVINYNNIFASSETKLVDVVGDDGQVKSKTFDICITLENISTSTDTLNVISQFTSYVNGITTYNDSINVMNSNVATNSFMPDDTIDVTVYHNHSSIYHSFINYLWNIKNFAIYDRCLTPIEVFTYFNRKNTETSPNRFLNSIDINFIKSDGTDLFPSGNITLNPDNDLIFHVYTVETDLIEKIKVVSANIDESYSLDTINIGRSVDSDFLEIHIDDRNQIDINYIANIRYDVPIHMISSNVDAIPTRLGQYILSHNTIEEDVIFNDLIQSVYLSENYVTYEHDTVIYFKLVYNKTVHSKYYDMNIMYDFKIINKDDLTLYSGSFTGEEENILSSELQTSSSSNILYYELKTNDDASTDYTPGEYTIYISIKGGSESNNKSEPFYIHGSTVITAEITRNLYKTITDNNNDNNYLISYPSVDTTMEYDPEEWDVPEERVDNERSFLLRVDDQLNNVYNLDMDITTRLENYYEDPALFQNPITTYDTNWVDNERISIWVRCEIYANIYIMENVNNYEVDFSLYTNFERNLDEGKHMSSDLFRNVTLSSGVRNIGDAKYDLHVSRHQLFATNGLNDITINPSTSSLSIKKNKVNIDEFVPKKTRNRFNIDITNLDNSDNIIYNSYNKIKILVFDHPWLEFYGQLNKPIFKSTKALNINGTLTVENDYGWLDHAREKENFEGAIPVGFVLYGEGSESNVSEGYIKILSHSKNSSNEIHNSIEYNLLPDDWSTRPNGRSWYDGRGDKKIIHPLTSAIGYGWEVTTDATDSNDYTKAHVYENPPFPHTLPYELYQLSSGYEELDDWKMFNPLTRQNKKKLHGVKSILRGPDEYFQVDLTKYFMNRSITDNNVYYHDKNPESMSKIFEHIFKSTVTTDNDVYMIRNNSKFFMKNKKQLIYADYKILPVIGIQIRKYQGTLQPPSSQTYENIKTDSSIPTDFKESDYEFRYRILNGKSKTNKWSVSDIHGCFTLKYVNNAELHAYGYIIPGYRMYNWQDYYNNDDGVLDYANIFEPRHRLTYMTVDDLNTYDKCVLQIYGGDLTGSYYSIGINLNIDSNINTYELPSYRTVRSFGGEYIMDLTRMSPTTYPNENELSELIERDSFITNDEMKTILDNIE